MTNVEPVSQEAVIPARDPAAVIPRPGRVPAFDVLRGVAVLLMFADHAALFLEVGGGVGLGMRAAGRLAAPLFFLAAGAVFRRLRWERAAVLLCAGVGVDLLAGSVLGSPNILGWLLLVSALWQLLRMTWALPWVLLACVVLSYYVGGVAGTYGPWFLFLCFAVGSWCYGELYALRLSSPVLEWFGRHALALYVGHVVALLVLSRVW